VILLDTNILYHILHKTSLTEEALTLLEDNPGEYVVDTIVHNELIYTPTLHHLEHRHGVKRAYSARKWIRKHGYPKEAIHAIEELIKRLNIRLVLNRLAPAMEYLRGNIVLNNTITVITLFSIVWTTLRALLLLKKITNII